MAEWIEKSLGEIAEVTKLAGFEFTKYIKYIDNGEIIALRALNLRNGELDLSDIKRISRKVSEGLTRSKIHKDDILLTYTGNGYGDCAIIEENDKYHLAPNICKIVPNQDVVFPYYLYCYISSNAFYNQMSNNMTGSGQPTIPMKTIRLLKIPVPDMSVQIKIANMIQSLNHKICNNKVINNNLEQQADALYQTFFSPKSGTQGKIVTLDEYCSIFTGKKNANASVNGGKYKFFTCAPEALQIDSYIFDGNAIIVSGNGAYTGRTRFYSGKFDLYQRTYACTLLDNVNPDFIFPLYWFVKLELSKKIMGGTRGSAIPYIVMNDLAKFEFVYNEEMFANYTPLFKSLTEAIQANEFESENLAQIRDSLLSKLMSGELDVSNIDI